ncbi:UNVERIFIED_CONTAM: hypothetical protein ITH36_25250, partial [Salmonella enterica subsp. enterica serovar Weltevreden]
NAAMEFEKELEAEGNGQEQKEKIDHGYEADESGQISRIEDDPSQPDTNNQLNKSQEQRNYETDGNKGINHELQKRMSNSLL